MMVLLKRNNPLKAQSSLWPCWPTAWSFRSPLTTELSPAWAPQHPALLRTARFSLFFLLWQTPVV